MKLVRQVFPFFCTLLLLCLGMYMPRLATLALEFHLRTETIQMENSDISLTLSQEKDFFQKLALFNYLVQNSENSMVEIEEDSQEYHMTSDEAAAAAKAAITEIKGGDKTYRLPTVVTPTLFMSEVFFFDQSCIFWNCYYDGSNYDNNSYSNASSSNASSVDGQWVQLWLDDQSGQVVGLILNMGDVTESAVSETVSLLAEFCRLHYPVDNVTWCEEKSNTFMITLEREQNGIEENYTISIRIHEGILFFNF